MTFTNPGHLQHHTFEETVGAQGHKIVHQVIAICYRGEDTTYATGLFLRRHFLKTETNGLFGLRSPRICVFRLLRIIGGFGHRFESCIGVVYSSRFKRPREL